MVVGAVIPRGVEKIKKDVRQKYGRNPGGGFHISVVGKRDMEGTDYFVNSTPKCMRIKP